MRSTNENGKRIRISELPKKSLKTACQSIANFRSEARRTVTTKQKSEGRAKLANFELWRYAMSNRSLGKSDLLAGLVIQAPVLFVLLMLGLLFV